MSISHEKRMATLKLLKEGRYHVEPKVDSCNGCPCCCSEESETISNYGCLPDMLDLVTMYLDNEGHWACHANNKIKCRGLNKLLKENNIPEDKDNRRLITVDNYDGKNKHKPTMEKDVLVEGEGT